MMVIFSFISSLGRFCGVIFSSSAISYFSVTFVNSELLTQSGNDEGCHIWFELFDSQEINCFCTSHGRSFN